MPERKRLLLHICCAPDATVPTLDLMAEGDRQDASVPTGEDMPAAAQGCAAFRPAWDIVGFFYGSNIHPRSEYEKRLSALHTLMENTGLSVIEAPYEPDVWLRHMTENDLMNEPEGGRRCAECFALQLNAAANEAARLGFSYICTTLTISPHKNVERINRIGLDAAARIGLEWENRVWRKQNGFLRSINLSKQWGLYRQNYCGCVASMRPPRQDNESHCQRDGA